MLTQTIPSYLYQEYSDDANLQGFVAAFNQLAQQYINWNNQINIPVWTGNLIVGPMLDWIANGLYGISRPVFTTSSSSSVGPINTFTINSIPINSKVTQTSGSATLATDDIFKRVLTWILYKGDGQQFSTPWLKRRLCRFLYGAGGVDPGITSTYTVGVAEALNTFNITLPSASPTSSILEQAINDGIVPLPFQFTYNVTVV